MCGVPRGNLPICTLSHSEHGPGGIADDLRLPSDLVLGSPLAADHRIMLDEESVLGLPYSAKTLPFRNKNRLVGRPMDLSCLDTDVRVAIAQDQALKGHTAPIFHAFVPIVLQQHIIVHCPPSRSPESSFHKPISEYPNT